jgi:hypothetical protein
MMLSDRGVAIADDALGPYPSPPLYARTVAWATEHGLGDRVAWYALCGDVTTVEIVKGKEVIHLATALACHRLVHGNRKRKAKRARRGRP